MLGASGEQETAPPMPLPCGVHRVREGDEIMTPRKQTQAGGKKGAAIAMAIAVAVLVLRAAPALAAPWWMPWGRGQHGYDPNTVVTLEATVRSAKPTPPMPSLEVETELGQAVTVILGPPWYLEQTGITFAPGDRVIVEGSKVMEHSGQLVVVAARVEKVQEKVTLRLRDEKGLPVWGGMGGGRMGGPGRGPMR